MCRSADKEYRQTNARDSRSGGGESPMHPCTGSNAAAIWVPRSGRFTPHCAVSVAKGPEVRRVCLQLKFVA